MFITKEMANIFFLLYTLFIALPFGGAIGWGTGKVMKKLLHETKRTFILDILLGLAGFLTGTWVSFIGFSLKERFEDGQLVYRKVTGFADYYYLLAASGAVLSVMMVHLVLGAIRRFCRKQNRPVEAS